MAKANVKIKDLAPGVVFNIGPAKAVILEHFANGKTLLATSEPVGFRPFTVRPFFFVCPEDEAPAPNNFAFASLKNDLNTQFLNAVEDGGVIPFDKIADATWCLWDHLGGPGYGTVTCKIGLLTEPEVRKYFDAGLLKIDDWEWTLTPNAGNANNARHVNTGGSRNNNYACNGHYGVRPAFYVESDTCISIEHDEVDLSDSALLREFSSKQLVEEVLRRIAAGETDDEGEGDDW